MEYVMCKNCISSIRYIICCRQKLNEEFQKQANTVIQQWEADVEKGREQEEKFQVLCLAYVICVKINFKYVMGVLGHLVIM